MLGIVWPPSLKSSLSAAAAGVGDEGAIGDPVKANVTAKTKKTEVIRKAGLIGVSVIAGEQEVSAEDKAALGAAPRTGLGADWQSYVLAAASVALATCVGLLAQPYVGLETIDLIFLVSVLSVAASRGLWPSLAASLGSSLCYNFFFIPPLHTFTITDPANVAAFAVFLIVALVVSQLAARVRGQVIAARSRARSTEALYGFARKIADADSLDDLLWAVAFQIASMLKLEVVLLMPENGTLTVRAAYPPDDELDAADLGAARWASSRARSSRPNAPTMKPNARSMCADLYWISLTLRGAHRERCQRKNCSNEVRFPSRVDFPGSRPCRPTCSGRWLTCSRRSATFRVRWNTERARSKP